MAVIRISMTNLIATCMLVGRKVRSREVCKKKGIRVILFMQTYARLKFFLHAQNQGL
jgi:hypothetical protein